MNIMTFDVEEWFHLLGFEPTSSENKWNGFEVRIYENVNRILQILDDTNTNATFFVVGWIAKQYPDLVKKISKKYQIGSHTMNHQLVWQMNKQSFKNDVESSVKLLQDITGKKIEAFRAPGFSITEKMGWAFETLVELGITTDCSAFPARHAHGGMPTYVNMTNGVISPTIIRYNSVTIKEFPMPIKKIGGTSLIFSGGGYFRLFPYPFIKSCTLQNNQYNLSYIHPRDLDPGQPIIKGLPLQRVFKSYVGLRGAEKKLRRYLTDFDFVDIATADKMVDWDNAPIISL